MKFNGDDWERLERFDRMLDRMLVFIFKYLFPAVLIAQLIDLAIAIIKHLCP